MISATKEHENTYHGERVIRYRSLDDGDLLVVMTRFCEQQHPTRTNVWLNDIRFRPANEQEAEELFLDLVQTCRRHFARRRPTS